MPCVLPQIPLKLILLVGLYAEPNAQEPVEGE